MHASQRLTDLATYLLRGTKNSAEYAQNRCPRPKADVPSVIKLKSINSIYVSFPIPITYPLTYIHPVLSIK